jgi:hypothetical protein
LIREFCDVPNKLQAKEERRGKKKVIFKSALKAQSKKKLFHMPKDHKSSLYSAFQNNQQVARTSF